jgi:hypothetical protein
MHADPVHAWLRGAVRKTAADAGGKSEREAQASPSEYSSRAGAHGTAMSISALPVTCAAVDHSREAVCRKRDSVIIEPLDRIVEEESI